MDTVRGESSSSQLAVCRRRGQVCTGAFTRAREGAVLGSGRINGRPVKDKGSSQKAQPAPSKHSIASDFST